MCKIETIINKKSLITLYLSKIFLESVHDHKVRGYSDPIPQYVEAWLILGIRNYDTNTVVHRKKNSGYLSRDDRVYKKPSRVRIVVGHVFEKLKQWKILWSVYRNFREKHSLRVNIVFEFIILLYADV